MLTRMSDIPDQRGWDRDGGNRVGEWTYDANRLCVVHTSTLYEIDLEKCDTSVAVLDWIFQVHAKTWATAETIHDLVAILAATLHPQGYLCSHGIERGPKPFTGPPRAPWLAERWYRDPRNPDSEQLSKANQ